MLPKTTTDIVHTVPNKLDNIVAVAQPLSSAVDPVDIDEINENDEVWLVCIIWSRIVAKTSHDIVHTVPNMLDNIVAAQPLSSAVDPVHIDDINENDDVWLICIWLSYGSFINYLFLSLFLLIQIIDPDFTEYMIFNYTVQ